MVGIFMTRGKDGRNLYDMGQRWSEYYDTGQMVGFFMTQGKDGQNLFDTGQR